MKVLTRCWCYWQWWTCLLLVTVLIAGGQVSSAAEKKKPAGAEGAKGAGAGAEKEAVIEDVNAKQLSFTCLSPIRF